ncbi:unannotated protein [freshwater metagenome]|uniref:Unannotated protein n=1 Tax=freshwater metagenome TaxID=449393 RepID=A0A6J6AJZ4_9ZZZZ
MMSTIARAVSGVSDAGFKIIVQPAAMAGPILRVAIAAGKFQGVIKSETPIGWCVTRMRLSPLGDLRKSPGTRTASSANQRKNSAAYMTSPFASVSTLPFSLETMVAIASASATMISNALRKISERTRGAVFAQSAAARSAAATAASHCSGPAMATSAITEPSLGSVTAIVAMPSTH